MPFNNGRHCIKEEAAQLPQLGKAINKESSLNVTVRNALVKWFRVRVITRTIVLSQREDIPRSVEGS